MGVSAMVFSGKDTAGNARKKDFPMQEIAPPSPPGVIDVTWRFPFSTWGRPTLGLRKISPYSQRLESLWDNEVGVNLASSNTIITQT